MNHKLTVNKKVTTNFQAFNHKQSKESSFREVKFNCKINIKICDSKFLCRIEWRVDILQNSVGGINLYKFS